MVKSITHTLNLIVKECPVCWVVYAMPESLNTECQRTGRDFYCPNGHSLIFTTSENKKLKQRIQDLETRLSARTQQSIMEAEARQRAEKKLASIQKRTAAGVCPCCHRSFTALRRHMKSKHPEFSKVITSNARKQTGLTGFTSIWSSPPPHAARRKRDE